MEAFSRNLDIVLEFASRVELYGDRDLVVTHLQALHLKEARAACARAVMTCYRDCELRGFSREEIPQTPVYRRLLQLNEMIHDLEDSLSRRNGPQHSNGSGSEERKGTTNFSAWPRSSL